MSSVKQKKVCWLSLMVDLGLQYSEPQDALHDSLDPFEEINHEELLQETTVSGVSNERPWLLVYKENGSIPLKYWPGHQWVNSS